jgi:hypothetical protein
VVPTIALGPPVSVRAPDVQPLLVQGAAGVLIPRTELRPTANQDSAQGMLPGQVGPLLRAEYLGPANAAREVPSMGLLHVAGRTGEPAGETEGSPTLTPGSTASNSAVPPMQRAGLLGEAAPADAGPLDVAIREFLGQLDNLGRDLTQGAARNGPLPWVLVAALGAAALEVGRRQVRRRERLVLDADDDEDTLTWVPGLPSSVAPEEP